MGEGCGETENGFSDGKDNLTIDDNFLDTKKGNSALNQTNKKKKNPY